MEVSLENLYVDIVPYSIKALLNIFHRKWSLIKIQNNFASTIKKGHICILER